MKFIKTIKILGGFFFFVFLMSTVVLEFQSSPVYSDEKDKSVVLVHLNFKDGKWSLGSEGVSILPCEAPGKYINGSESDPLFRVLRSGDKEVYKRHIRNPRLISIEDPVTQTKLLDEVSFKLRFALIDDMEKVEFWYEPSKQNEPSVTVDLRNAIQIYREKGGPDQKAPCKEPEYVPDQLKKGKEKKSSFQ